MLALLFNTLLALGLSTLFYWGYLWHPYDAWLGGCTIVTFLMYGIDKAQAIRNRRRVPKRVLHALVLMGGFLGGWFGMFGFWHKVRHYSFWLILTLSMLLHGGFMYYIFS